MVDTTAIMPVDGAVPGERRGHPRRTARGAYDLMEMGLREELEGLRRHIAGLEEALAWEAGVSASLTILARRLLTSAPIEEISDLVLEHALRLTGSAFGYVGYIDPDTGCLVCPTLTREAWDACEVGDKKITFSEFKGLFGWVLSNREALVSNDIEGDPRSVGTPEGHLPVKRFISAPALSGDELVGQIALANADRDYDDRDLALVGLLADCYALAVRRERAEEALRGSEERYRLIYDFTGEAIYTYDTDLAVIGVNRRACELIGYDEEEVIGRNVLELGILHPDDLERAVQDVARLFRGEVVVDELRFITRDGAVVLGEVTGAPLFNKEGEIIAFTNVAIDITARRKWEEGLQRINRELDAYAYVVSHDLRGPLSAIISAAGLLVELADQAGDEKVASRIRQVAEIIDRSADNAEDFIERLLDLAKAGQAPKAAVMVDVAGVVRRVLEERAAVIAETGAEVVVDEDLGHINADPTHVYQLFSNLIENALQYNESPEPLVTVSHLGGEGGVHRYRVRDNGQGIPRKDLEKMFLPLYKGRGGGTGIGLSTVRKVVGVYGGEIGARNDGGACFEFTLRDWTGGD